MNFVRADFEAAAQFFNLETIDERLIEVWNRHVRLSPAEAGAILTRDLPGKMRITLSAVTDKQDILSERLDAFGADNKQLFFSVSSFDFANATAYPEDIKVNNAADYGQGIGRRLMANPIEFAVRVGLRESKITATNSNGAYTWARFGYELDMYGKQLAWLSGFLHERFELVRAYLPAAVIAEIEPLLDLSDLQDICAIAGCDFNLRDVLPLEMFYRAGRLYVPQFENEIAKRLVDGKPDLEHFDIRMVDYAHALEGMRCLMERVAAHNLPLRLGQFLLVGQQWNGRLYFNDHVQMHRAGAYVGGWNFIEPAIAA
jgi:hypothetical protein